MRRPSRKLFYRVPVAISSREVHFGKVAVGAEHRINETDTLEEFRPIHRGHKAHARDRITHCHVHRALSLMLLADDLIGSRSLGCKTLVQPTERRRHGWILIAQTL